MVWEEVKVLSPTTSQSQLSTYGAATGSFTALAGSVLAPYKRCRGQPTEVLLAKGEFLNNSILNKECVFIIISGCDIVDCQEKGERSSKLDQGARVFGSSQFVLALVVFFLSKFGSPPLSLSLSLSVYLFIYLSLSLQSHLECSCTCRGVDDTLDLPQQNETCGFACKTARA